MLSANISNETRKAVYRRDHYRCVLCDSDEGLQIHHAVPRGKGGTGFKHNLVTLCWRCHAMIHGTQFPDWPEWMTKEEMEQAVVEYLADYYAEVYGLFWNPWAEKMLSLEEHYEEGG